MEPIVTVAIASYNNAPYVGRCVESVLSQTYPNIEILVIDDGSSDESEQIISTYKRIEFFRKENGGLSSSREQALKMANGSYICFIDADDYCHEKYVEDMVNKIINDKADICVCGTTFLDMDGNELKKLTKGFTFNEEIPTRKIDIKLLSSSFNDMNNFYKASDSWNKLYKRDFLIENGIHFVTPKGFNGTDSSFNKRVLLHEPIIAIITSRRYYHVIYEHSAVHRKNKNHQMAMQFLYGQVEDEAIKIGIKEKLSTELSRLYYATLRDAFEDVYIENRANKGKIESEYVRMMGSHNEFAKVHDITTVENENFSKSINMFVRCLRTNNVHSIINHIRFRKMILDLLK